MGTVGCTEEMRDDLHGHSDAVDDRVAGLEIARDHDLATRCAERAHHRWPFDLGSTKEGTSATSVELQRLSRVATDEAEDLIKRRRRSGKRCVRDEARRDRSLEQPRVTGRR